MLVTDITISQYQYCPKSARHMANVCMTLKDQFITLFCQLNLPENESSRMPATAFVDDALRQLRRMPEFRSGRKTLEVSDGLLAGSDLLAA